MADRSTGSDIAAILRGRSEDGSVPLCATEDISKTYGTGTAATRALDGVTISLHEGEFVAVIGQSGSGKSTLLNILGLLDAPTCGTVRYRGRDVGRLDKQARSELRNSLIGFVFQFHYLLPEFSVYENVAMPVFIGKTLSPSATKERAEETLQLLGLGGLEGKNANELSGGQKQRVAIARALMNRPALLLADEPTGNLDTVNTRLVYDLFRKINDETGTAFAIVTHDWRIAEQADRIIEVCDGRIVDEVPDGHRTYDLGRPEGEGGYSTPGAEKPEDLSARIAREEEAARAEQASWDRSSRPGDNSPSK